MSETTTPAAPAAVAPVEAPKARARLLPANYVRMNGNDFAYRSWYVNGLPNNHEFSDLFHPYYWSLTRIVKNDLVRVVAIDGSWDVTLKCVETENGGGAHMELWPKFPAGLGGSGFGEVMSAAAESTDALGAATMPRLINGQPVPRVDHTAATQWRLIGLNGHSIKEGMDSKAKADKELAAYAKRMKIEL